MQNARLITSNNKLLIITIDGERRFVIRPYEVLADPFDLVVQARGVEFNEVKDTVYGYNFYLDEVANSNFLG